MQSIVCPAIERMPQRVRKLLNQLEAYARRKKLTQKELAAELGIKSQQQLNDWFTGHRVPNGERILQIQEFLARRKGGEE
jgi:transcriptional regulator with XRE-family HTH domain